MCSGSSSNWGDVTCSAGVVTGLLLGGLNLVGTVPVELGLLTALSRLQLQNNGITGSIPTSLGKISSLTYLNAADNSLVRVVPTAVGTLSNMRYLNLQSNSLTGVIPGSLCAISSLSFLNVAGNRLDCYGSCLSSIASRNFGSGVLACTAGKYFYCFSKWSFVVVFVSTYGVCRRWVRFDIALVMY